MASVERGKLLLIEPLSDRKDDRIDEPDIVLTT
jgi:hypothetical protein